MNKIICGDAIEEMKKLGEFEGEFSQKGYPKDGGYYSGYCKKCKSEETFICVGKILICEKCHLGVKGYVKK